MDKSKAVYEWIKDCPVFDRLYFNFGVSEVNTSAFIPIPTDYTVKKDIFGTETKHYDFAVSFFDFVDDSTYDGSENVNGIELMQQFSEWIKSKSNNRFFPDFGKKCIIEKIEAVQNIPASLRMQNISKYLSQYRIFYEENN